MTSTAELVAPAAQAGASMAEEPVRKGHFLAQSKPPQMKKVSGPCRFQQKAKLARDRTILKFAVISEVSTRGCIPEREIPILARRRFPEKSNKQITELCREALACIRLPKFAIAVVNHERHVVFAAGGRP